MKDTEHKNVRLCVRVLLRDIRGPKMEAEFAQCLCICVTIVLHSLHFMYQWLPVLAMHIRSCKLQFSSS